MKKFICLCLILAFSVTAFAADYTSYADRLNELGLFNGTDSGYALEGTLTREQAEEFDVYKAADSIDDIINSYF